MSRKFNEEPFRCTELETIDCSSVEKMGHGAFFYCSSLKDFLVGDKLESILDKQAFDFASYCKSWIYERQPNCNLKENKSLEIVTT